MQKYYKCSKCGKITRGKYKESQRLGSYHTVRCECGNKGSSGNDWHYKIKGFKIVDPENKIQHEYM